MKKIATLTLGIMAAGVFAASASAAGIDDMVGKWKWENFVVECAKGGEFGLTCKVVSGPKNVGMEMIMSPIEKKGDSFFGKVKHPGTGEVYRTNMKMTGKDAWTLDGCTEQGACAKGTFMRVK